MFEAVLVRNVMIPLPLTIDIEQTLAEAQRLMLALDIRHLPVLSGERCVGLLSERDISLAGRLGMDLQHVAIGNAMSVGPFVVPPEQHLTTVVREMAERKLGSAVVVDDGRVVGMFTSTDALRLLSQVLKHTNAWGPIEMSPNVVFSRLRKEQSVLSSIKQAARSIGLAALNEDPAALEELPACARRLDQAVLRYIELEEELLIPLLVETSPEGAIRAELLHEQHRNAQRQIHMARLALLSSDSEHLASAVLSMCGE